MLPNCAENNDNTNNAQQQDIVFSHYLNKLRKENLWINAEKADIKHLNETIKSKNRELITQAWLAAKKRLTLLPNRVQQTRTNLTDKNPPIFHEASRIFGYQHAAKLGTLLQFLRHNPYHLADLLLVTRDLNIDVDLSIIDTILTGVYGACVYSTDLTLTLTLMCDVARKQLKINENNRVDQLLRKSNSPFRRFYYVFNEIYQPTRVFLAMTLADTVKDILTFSDFYIDLDPVQTALRYDMFDPEIRRKEILDKLAEFLRKILHSLCANARLFPRPLAWLICQVRRECQQHSGATIDSSDIDVIVELLISQLICPAILDPEFYGLSDCQVGIYYDACARHNLITVSRLMQIYAHASSLSADAQCAADIFELLANVDRDEQCVSFGHIVTLLLDVDLVDEMVEAPTSVGLVPELTRDVMIFSEEELNNLMAVLQKKPGNNALLTDQLAALSIQPSPTSSAAPPINSSTQQNGECASINSSTTKLLIFPLEDGATTKPIGLLCEDKVLDLYSSSSNDVLPLSATTLKKNDTCQHQPPELNVNNNLEEAETANSVVSSLELNDDDLLLVEGEIMINEDDIDDDDDVIILNEEEVDNLSDMVSANVSGRGTPNISGRDTPSSQINGNNGEINDNGNMAPLEIRQQDGASAAGGGGEGGVSSSATLTTSQQQQQRHSDDIDDKFCKFDIKRHLIQQHNDSNMTDDNMTAVSVISDTWSTDVLASDDNDTLIMSVTTSGNNVAGNTVIMNVGGVVVPTELSETLSETQSESAWSTDVMTSDTERLTEDLSNVSCQPEDDDDDDDEVGEGEKNSHKNSLSSSSSSSSSSNDPSSSHSFDNNTPPQQTVNKMTTINSRNVAVNVDNIDIVSKQQNDDSLTKKKGGIVKIRSLATVSTGAIPKTISFDTSNNNNNNNDSNRRMKQNATTSQQRIGGFFGRFRKNFTKKRDGSTTSVNSHRTTVNNHNSAVINYDSSNIDVDILEKYRKSTSTSTTLTEDVKIASSLSLSLEEEEEEEEEKNVDRCQQQPMTLSLTVNNNRKKEEEEMSSSLLASVNCTNDEENVNNSLTDVKRKITLVLGNLTTTTTTEMALFLNKHTTTTKTKLETILRIAVAQKWRQNGSGDKIDARAAEALRCVQSLNDSACQNLMTALKRDLRQRGHAYHAYLIDAKQQLLMCDSLLTMLLEEIAQTHAQNALYEVTVRVRTYLQEHESRVMSFCQKFICHLQMADEKCDFLRTFLAHLEQQLFQKNDKLSSDVNNLTRLTLERAIIDRVYTNALYPNGDGDRDRDRVLHDHICQLAMSMSMSKRTAKKSNKDFLMIPSCYRRELPWQPAQYALKQMNVVRTPRDKLTCVRRCAIALFELLGLSSGAQCAAADDFTPILVYVIIQVNPVALLSTIQYVNTFYSGQIGGEDEYWWTQFCACVEYIKTMDYY